MNEEQIKVWREEFDINFFNGASFRRESSEASFIRDSEAYRLKMDGYLAGRKKAQEEIDSTSFRRGYELVKNHEKEIAQLKEELKREREFIQELKVYMLNDTENYDGEEYVDMIQTQQQQRRIEL